MRIILWIIYPNVIVFASEGRLRIRFGRKIVSIPLSLEPTFDMLEARQEAPLRGSYIGIFNYQDSNFTIHLLLVVEGGLLHRQQPR